MQANQLILSVDHLNNDTPSSENYDRYEEYQNRSVYIGINHTPSARDTISMYRTFPSKSGNFNGVQKTTVKTSKDQGVLGADGVATLTAPLIIEASFSIPVGTTAAEVLAARQRLIALLDDDSIMDPLNVQLMV